MKPSFKLALKAGLATIPLVSYSAMASEKNTIPGYVTDSQGVIVRTGFGECWHTERWKPGMAVPGCDGYVAAVEPEPVPPEPVPPEPEPVPAEEHLTLSNDGLFDFNKAQLRLDIREKLDGLIENVKTFATVDRVVVTGHADRLGSDSYNMKLSRKRAEAVRDYLQDREIADPSKIEVDARGESEPVEECDGVRSRKKLISCLAPNRRVQIDVTGTKVQ